MKYLTVAHYDAYFFGYCDGRNIGEELSINGIDEDYRWIYKNGYEEGIADYCRYELKEIAQ